MADVITFQNQEWIDAQVEYFKLPLALQINDNKWDRRLKALKIRCVLPDVRTTERGNIANLRETGREFKSKYILKSVWDRAVAAAIASLPHERNGDGAEEDVVEGHGVEDGEDTGQEDAEQGAENMESERDQDDNPRRTLHELTLTATEHLYYNDQALGIRVYGERTVDGLFLHATDVCNAIGTLLHNMPDMVHVEKVVVDGVVLPTLSWDDFCTLAVLKAHKHPIAAAIKKWIIHTLFAVQFQTGVDATQQSEFASRGRRFSFNEYTSHLNPDDFVIYAIDAFPAEAFEATYPGTVTPLLGEENLTGRRIVKLGCGKPMRISGTRCDLNRILPGHDPRPIFIMKVPCVSSTEELKTKFETPLHAEFADMRIGHEGRVNVPGPRNTSYTELFVLDTGLKELAERTASKLVNHHIQAMSDRSTMLLSEANQRLNELEQRRVESKVLETEVRHLQIALEKSEDECVRLRDAIAQVLPRKMSALKAAFARVTS